MDEKTVTRVPDVETNEDEELEKEGEVMVGTEDGLPDPEPDPDLLDDDFGEKHRRRGGPAPVPTA